MRLIVVISKNKGIAFNGRRQSRDAALIEDILRTAEGHLLFCSPYSKTIIPPVSSVIFDPDYLCKAGEDDFCFHEKGESELNSLPIEIILYHWNRDYPADEFFKIDKKKYNKVSENTFEGKSHKKITKEVWKKC